MWVCVWAELYNWNTYTKRRQVSWPNEHARVAAYNITYSQLIVVPCDTAQPTR